MLAIFFKTAWRNIVHGRVYSLLNILGLATGMAVALLIGLWVHDQYRWDDLAGFILYFSFSYFPTNHWFSIFYNTGH